MKKISLLIIALAFAFTAQAQLFGYKWRFGVSAGTTNYIGDIRPMKIDNFKDFTKLYKRYEAYSDQLSYQVSLEYALGKSVGLMLSGGTYQFGSSDRFIKNDGQLYSESPTFDRALNFQTDLYDAGLSLVFKPDNNWLLSGKSFFAPYFTVGIGVQNFKVKGDLLDAIGNRYDYTNTSLIPDGKFETNLTNLHTENPSGYETITMYANLGLGVRFRITKSIELFAQSDFKRAATDYLDDVSGKYRNVYDSDFQRYAAKPGTNRVSSDNPYRGMNNDRGDWYIYHGVGIKLSLGANKKSFNPPVISQRYFYTPTEGSQKQIVKKDSLVTPIPQSITNNYITVIQLPSNGIKPNQPTKSVTDSATLVRIQFQIDSLTDKRSSLSGSKQEFATSLNDLDQAIVLAKEDTTLSEEITKARIQTIENRRNQLISQNDQISAAFTENELKIDSLSNLRSAADSMSTSMENTGITGSMISEILVYPGQVSRILYSFNVQRAYLDSAYKNYYNLQPVSYQQPIANIAQFRNTDGVPTAANMMTNEKFQNEMQSFKKDILSSQARRDSAMIMAFSSQTRTVSGEELARYQPQQIQYTTDHPLDSKTSKRLRKNRVKQEQLHEKNNEILKDAILVGGAAATTAAISSSGKKKEASENTENESALRERIAQDSILIDSLSNVKIIADTIVTAADTITVIKENQIKTLLDQSKIEVYFEVNKSTLNAQEIEKILPVAKFMEENPEVKIDLIGFADNTGSIQYNLALTKKRVQEVVKVLIEKFGIDPERIEESNGGLIIRGSTKGSQETDRKVEIRVNNI
jgi:outer membrane protein OmpA-like peptidoglycan-associated protein